MQDLVCGIDVGTSAVRVLVCDLAGAVVSNGGVDLPAPRVTGARREQDAEGWWRAVCAALRAALRAAPAEAIRSVCVDATSGTIVLVDSALRPLTPGSMYNDARAAGYGERINAVAADFIARHGYRFKDDFSLSRMLWMMEHEPAFAAAFKVLHQSDFVNARLMGCAPATDWSSALKSGCDLHRAGWPEFIGGALGFPTGLLPDRVVAPGAALGALCDRAAAETGLRPGIAVVAGASDGTASLFASGAGRPGDFNTALGSTITIKGISPDIVRDPDGVIYCHRHPEGHWLPGGASNVGCAALNAVFAPDAEGRGAALRALDAGVDRSVPAPLLVYPLGDSRDERFPFKKRDVAAFESGPSTARDGRYAGYLQGIAFVERWCYEKLAALGAPVRRVFATGGGSRSEVWSRLRADVLGVPLVLPEQTETAFGAAILAAAHVRGRFGAASDAMVRTRRAFEPSGRDFEPAYQAFRDECRRRWGV